MPVLKVSVVTSIWLIGLFLAFAPRPNAPATASIEQESNTAVLQQLATRGTRFPPGATMSVPAGFSGQN